MKDPIKRVDTRVSGDGPSLSGECGRNGDRYYRAMTDWTAKNHGRDIDLARKCVDLGSEYLKSLDKLIKLPPKQRRSFAGVELSKLRAMEYKVLLMQDLNMLERILKGAGDGHKAAGD